MIRNKTLRKCAKNVLKLFAPLIRDDRWFVCQMYRLRMGRPIDIDNPVTYNEKLQWLKLYNRRPEQTLRVDKLRVKDHVAALIGADKVIPTIASWKRAADIDFDSLPERFVLKTNQGWGGKGVIVCRDKSKLDRRKAVALMDKWLHKSNFHSLREWPYRGIEPCVMAEQLIEEDGCDALTDYKFFCFNGRAEYVMLCKGRVPGRRKPRYYYFDREWNFHPFNKIDSELPAGFTLPRPQGIDEMFAIADVLCRDEAHVRVDLYNTGGRIYFGEITYFNSSGYDTDISDATNRHFGELLILPDRRQSLSEAAPNGCKRHVRAVP